MSLQSVAQVLLFVHAFAGFCALFGAVVAAGNKTFNLAHRWHVYGGRIFFGGMVGVFVTAIPLSIFGADVFLFLVALFSGYLAWSGLRYARNRGGAIHWLDWARASLMFLVAVAMVVYGARLIFGGDNGGVTLLVFAFIAAALSLGDMKIFRAGGVTGTARIRRHLSMMLGGLIATVTAFVVVNFTFAPGVVLWLAPTLVITPFIVFWNRKLRQQES